MLIALLSFIKVLYVAVNHLKDSNIYPHQLVTMVFVAINAFLVPIPLGYLRGQIVAKRKVLYATAHCVVAAAALSNIAEFISIFHVASVEERPTPFNAGVLVGTQATTMMPPRICHPDIPPLYIHPDIDTAPRAHRPLEGAEKSLWLDADFPSWWGGAAVQFILVPLLANIMLRVNFIACAAIPLLFAGIISTANTFNGGNGRPFLVFLMSFVLIALMYAMERSFRLYFLLQLKSVRREAELAAIV